MTYGEGGLGKGKIGGDGLTEDTTEGYLQCWNELRLEAAEEDIRGDCAHPVVCPHRDATAEKGKLDRGVSEVSEQGAVLQDRGNPPSQESVAGDE